MDGGVIISLGPTIDEEKEEDGEELGRDDEVEEDVDEGEAGAVFPRPEEPKLR